MQARTVLCFSSNEKHSYLRNQVPPDHIKESPKTAPTQPARPAADRVVSARELLGGAHRVWIEHAAERYLLQVTRNGKLILTK